MGSRKFAFDENLTPASTRTGTDARHCAFSRDNLASAGPRVLSVARVAVRSHTELIRIRFYAVCCTDSNNRREWSLGKGSSRKGPRRTYQLWSRTCPAMVPDRFRDFLKYLVDITLQGT